MGVCSVFSEDQVAITCPIRFRQDWIIAEDAARFFFPAGVNWTSLSEVRLNDKNEQSAGNIDHVLVSYDNHGEILDFGALEVQAVYISGNIRRPFESYMQDPNNNTQMDWSKQRNYPRPDYLSSSRKRLAPQLIYKGGILHHWGKKQAVAIHQGFYDTLPKLKQVTADQAEMVWLVYNLIINPSTNQYQLTLTNTIYTMFQEALSQIATPEPGLITDFIFHLQERLDEKFDGDANPPDAPIITDLL